MIAARAVRIAAATALALGAASCARHRVAAPAASPGPPPEVVEAYPAPLSEHVPYDLTEVWMRFAEPLDSSSVTQASVFLKLDTRRAPVTVRWEAATRRIVLSLQAPLELAETYTVEVRPSLRAASGTALGTVHWWQFTVSGLRRQKHPFPVAGAAPVSPHSPLTWDRTESSAGSILYDLYVAPDSAAVAARSVSPISGTAAEYVPYETPWRSGTRTFWAITARNLTQGEREDGPVWSFETFAPGAPIDSVSIPAPFHGWYEAPSGRSFCMQNRLLIGPGIQPIARWDLGAIRPERAIAGAKIEMVIVIGTIPPPSDLVALHTPIAADACDLRSAGTPGPEVLAFSVNSGGPGFYYMSEALGTFVAAMHHGLGSASGIALRSSRSSTFGSPPILKLYYYR